MNWQHIDHLLDWCEARVPRCASYRTHLYLSRAFGLTIGAALGIPMWTQGVNGWTIDGKREPLAYRVSVAFVIWKARYWWDWSEAYPDITENWGKA